MVKKVYIETDKKTSEWNYSVDEDTSYKEKWEYLEEKYPKEENETDDEHYNRLCLRYIEEFAEKNIPEEIGNREIYAIRYDMGLLTYFCEKFEEDY